MAIKVKLKNGSFEPIENIEKINKKYNGKELQIEILPQIEELIGVLKDLKTDSVSLQHKIKDMW